MNEGFLDLTWWHVLATVGVILIGCFLVFFGLIFGAKAHEFCNPKPRSVRQRRRLSPILGPDGKPLIVTEDV